MSKERLFVICEVEVDVKWGDKDEIDRVQPIDHKDGEFMYLHRSRIIKASRLRYGVPKEGELYFDEVRGFTRADKKFQSTMTPIECLILDPEPPEPGDDDSWLIG